MSRPFKMKGFSGFGNSPLRQGTWQGLGKTDTALPVIKKSTGVNKKIVNAVVGAIVPGNAAEAVGYVAGGGVVKGLKNIGSKIYQGAKTLKIAKDIS
jgi:hypothetical protein